MEFMVGDFVDNCLSDSSEFQILFEKKVTLENATQKLCELYGFYTSRSIEYKLVNNDNDLYGCIDSEPLFGDTICVIPNNMYDLKLLNNEGLELQDHYVIQERNMDSKDFQKFHAFLDKIDKS